MKCRQCTNLRHEIMTKQGEVARLARVLSRIREDKRPAYLEQVKEAKASLSGTRDALFLHEVDCPETDTPRGSSATA